MINCRKCLSTHTQRVHREWWMRLVPRSICIKCSDCGEIFLARPQRMPPPPARPPASYHP